MKRITIGILAITIASLWLMGCETGDANNGSSATGSSSGQCGVDFDMCGVAGGHDYGDCCAGYMCRAEPNQPPYSFCAAICSSSAECPTNCCALMPGTTVAVCQPNLTCLSSNEPCGGGCGPNAYCDSATNQCVCPSQCQAATASTCCGGPYCSGDCIGNPCCN